MKYTPVRVLMTEFADSSKGDKMLVNGYMYTQKAVKRNSLLGRENRKQRLTIDITEGPSFVA